MPLQPAFSARSATNAAARNHFQFRFIDCTVEAVQGMATMIWGRLSFMLVSTARWAICSTVIFAAATCLGADSNTFAARAERAFHDAEKLAGTRPVAVSALVQLAHAAFDAAEFTRSDDRREEFATRGIDAARSAIEREPTNAAAHYWLGMDLGQLARTKTLGALKLVHEMESEFQRAAELDAGFDYAGADRSLGYLYRDAPGWPTSIGNKKKAREHFEQAVKLHPEFPDNQLGLVESFEKWSDRPNFEKQLKVAERVMAEAEKKFTDPTWEASWADWKKRLAELKRKSGSVGTSLPTKGVK
jgi:tetratricopeptide (TPR) repeat protein